MAKCGINIFLLSSIILHWQKPLLILLAIVNCSTVLKKRRNFFYFQWPKVDKVRNECSSQLSKFLYNCKLKNKEAH
jgi:hypothetical protein